MPTRATSNRGGVRNTNARPARAGVRRTSRQKARNAMAKGKSSGTSGG